MIEMTEVALKQKAANILENESDNNNQPQQLTAVRKIEFDKGIPQSFDFAKNDVNTIEYNVIYSLNPELEHLQGHIQQSTLKPTTHSLYNPNDILHPVLHIQTS
jgi:hypothetical protein